MGRDRPTSSGALAGAGIALTLWNAVGLVMLLRLGFQPSQLALGLVLGPIPLTLMLPISGVLREPVLGSHVAYRAVVLSTLVILSSGAIAPHLGPLVLDPLARVVLSLSGIAVCVACVVAVAAAAREVRAGAPTPDATPEAAALPAVPDMGVLMRAYLVSDWMLLRLAGAGLLGIAWMLHTALPDDPRLGAVLHGVARDTATILYAGWGAALLFPFLLPKAIARPSTVLGGAVKAGVLLALTILCLPAVDLAIDLHVGRTYRSAFHAAVPGLFKGVAGLAVLAPVLVALFRHLGKAPPPPKPKRKAPLAAPPPDLRSLRQGRMPA